MDWDDAKIFAWELVAVQHVYNKMQLDGKFPFMINLISMYSLWIYWPLPIDHETVSLVNVNTNSNNFNIFNISQITAFGLDDIGKLWWSSEMKTLSKIL